MELIIKGEPKEIAALVLAVQRQRRITYDSRDLKDALDDVREYGIITDHC